MAYTLNFTLNFGTLTGLTLNAKLYDAVGTQTGSTITTGFVEIGNGVYSYLATIPDGHQGTFVAYKSTDAAVKVSASVNPQEAEYSDAKTTSRLAPSEAGRTLDVSAAGEAGIDWGNVGSPTTAVALSGTTISTAQAVASVSGAVTLSAADSLVIATGTAAAGTATTITLQTAMGTDNLVNGCLVKITSGTGAKQCRVITGYVDATKVVTVDRVWTTAPDSTSVYAILYQDQTPLNASLLASVDFVVQSVDAASLAGSATAVDTLVSALTGVGGGTIAANVKTVTTGAIGTTAFAAGATIPRVTLVDTLTTYTGNTVQTGDSFARLGVPAGVSVSADITAVKADTGNLITRITATLFSGITSLAQWLGLLAGKQTGNSTARAEVRATGTGSGAYDETTDSQEALRDRGDSAWGSGSLTTAAITAAIYQDLLTSSDFTTVGSVGELLRTALGRISTGAITLTAPTSPVSGDVDIVQGDAYTLARGRQLDWSDDGTWTDLADAAIAWEVGDGTLAATGSVVSNVAGSRKVRVEATSAQTQLLEAGAHDYAVVATFPGTDADRVTLALGVVNVTDRESN